MLVKLTPDKIRTCTRMMKAAFLPLSATCPVVTVTMPKCFPDACIENQHPIMLPAIHFQGYMISSGGVHGPLPQQLNQLDTRKVMTAEPVLVPLLADTCLNTSTVEACFYLPLCLSP